MTNLKMNLSPLVVILLGATMSFGTSGCSKNSPQAVDPSTEGSAPSAPDSSESPPPVATETYDEYHVDGVAGGVMIRRIELEAEVLSVDQEAREAVLRGPEGNEVVVKVGEGAVNFYQVEPGHRVNVMMQRELVVYVPEDQEQEPDGTAMAAAQAQPGERPGARVVSSTKITSTISAMDEEARTATLTFPDGERQIFDVRPDVDMSHYEVGQEVVFFVTDLLALDVEKL